MKKIRLLTILAFILGSLLIFASCGKVKLTTPNVDTFIVDEATLLLTWEPVKNAKGYKVLVNNEEFNTTKPRYPLDPLDPGVYNITVQAVGLSESIKDSGWSATYEYERLTESGLSYALINNNTEYEVRGLGEASGNIKIDDFYRGKPVTSIGDMAFANKASSLASIEMGENIRKIGARAFLNCSMLTEIEIPESVTEIGAYAFQGCRGLVEITIPDTVTKIDNYAFAYCRGLTKVTIPDSIESIGAYAFSACDLLNNVVIPDSVVTLGEYAFSKSVGLTTITLGNGLETISKYAFLDCANLSNVTFGNKLKVIDDYAFSGCASSEAMLNSNGWSIELPDSLETIGLGAFINSKALAEVDLGEGLQKIGNGAFAGTYLADVAAKLPSGFTFIDGWVITYSGTEAPTAFPEGTIGIADWAFATIDAQKKPVGFDSLWTKGSWNMNMPDTVRYIGERAFAACTKLNRLYIGTDMVQVGKYAFAQCSGLSRVTFAEGVQVIDDYAFQACSDLDDVQILGGEEGLPTTVKRVGTYAFDGTKYYTTTWDGPVYIGNWLVGWNETVAPVEEAEIEEGTIGIADWAFYDAVALHTVEFPRSLRYIGRSAFAYCASLSTVVLRPGIEIIDDYTFYQCAALSQIEIPSTVTHIGYSAFNKCYGLTSITIPAATTSIDEYAFYKCTSLTEVTFETKAAYTQETGGTKTIGARAFLGCIALADVVLPESLENLSTHVFYKCTGLKSVTFTGSKLTEIPVYTFYGCTALESVTLSESMKTIGNFAFRNCEALTEINFVEGLEEIGRYSFYGCAAIESIELPASLKKLGDYAFRNCGELKSVILPQTLTTIGKHAFNGANKATFYAEVSARPSLWIGQWNSSNRPVVWGCTLSQDKSYVVSFVKTATSVVNTVATNGIAAPTRAGYVFAGWATSQGGSAVYTMENFMDAPNGTTLYTVWSEVQSN